ncbi:MAG: hypothetical protein FWC58_10005 [Desulfobulbus sp.]|nr:hypothetical protein [Desulfobulbus sp.]
MRAQTVSAADGWRWLAAGFAIFQRNPPVLSFLVMIYWLIMALLRALPPIIALPLSLAMPGLLVGLMQAVRNIERGQAASVQTLVDGLRENTRTLILLGVLQLVTPLVILGLSTVIDGGTLLQYMMAANRAERAALEDADFTLSALFVLFMLAPALMAWWFAPVLAAWHRQPLGKALFFSFVACWLNWRAFLAYGAALLVAGLVPVMLFGLLASLLPGAASVIQSLLIVFMVLVMAPAIFASFYVSYRDIFAISEIV